MSLFGLNLAIILCLFIWGLSITGFLDTPSSLTYDLFARIAPQQTGGSEDILLVEAEYGSRYQGDETWVRLLETLDHKGARQVIFFFFPEAVTADFYQTASSLEYVYFGREISGHPDEDIDSDLLQPLPRQAAGYPLQTGVLPPSSVVYGIHRDYQPFVSIDGQPEPHVILLAARERNGEALNPPNPFRVDFIGRHRPLPKISLSRIFTEDIIQELIRDKTVLVGFAPPFPFKGYSTPITPDSSSMSPLEYHGLALQTLLNHTELSFPGPWEILACLVIVTAIALMMHQYFGSFVLHSMGVLLFILTPLAAWLLVVWTKNWFPVIEVLLVYTLFFLLISARDGLFRNKLALRILLDQSLKRQEKIMPKSFFRSEDYWPLVINMIKQTLNIERTIFLEAVEGDHRVCEVIALNSSLEDIRERRRDYHRTPYKTAIEKNTAIPVDSFFTSLSGNEQSYLVPLNFFGQVQGFWAFTIDAEMEKQTPELLNLVNSLAREIGELLYRRKQWVVEGQWQNDPLRKLLNMEKYHEPYNEINRITAFLARRVSVLESVFNALETGTILYNPFGMVVQSNRKMTRLLKTLDINAYSMSALDFAVQLSGESPQKVRQLLGRVIVNHETKQLSIPGKRGNGRNLILNVRPLIATDDTANGDDPHPIEMNGFFFEIVDVEEAVKEAPEREKLWLIGLKQLRKELESFAGDMRVTLTDRCGGKNQDQCRCLREDYENLMGSVKALDERIEKELLVGGTDVFPVDLLECLHKTLHQFQPDLEQRNIELALKTPDDLPPVLAAAEELVDLLQALLSLLVSDALDGSVVMVTVESKPENVCCLLSNTGVGMPPEAFQRFLTAPQAKDRIEFHKIHRSQQELKRWRASFSGSSNFGRGLSFRLTFTSLG